MTEQAFLIEHQQMAASQRQQRFIQKILYLGENPPHPPF